MNVLPHGDIIERMEHCVSSFILDEYLLGLKRSAVEESSFLFVGMFEARHA